MNKITLSLLFLILAVKGFSNENIQKAFKSGGVDYITKPFNSDELLTRIKTHIDLNNCFFII